MQRSNKISILAALMGHVIERLEVALYGYLSILLAPLFFPFSETLAIISSLGAFAAGYVMRPLGGIVFGYLGDRYGRKKAFLWSVFLTVLPTLTIGLLPTWQTIGFAAPIILIGCRLMQGLCTGGEFSGAGIFVGEHTKSSQDGFWGSLICMTGLLGGLMATILGFICFLPAAPSWSWRLAFLLTGSLGILSYLLRKRMSETPIFKKYKDIQTTNIPILTVFKENLGNVFSAIAIGGCGHSVLYMSTIYMNVLYKTKLGLASHDIMFINASILGLWIFLCPMVGRLADRVGVMRYMTSAAFSMILLSYPAFWYLSTHMTKAGFLTFQAILTIAGVSFVAPISGLFTRLFPVGTRYSGVAFSITLGQAIFGGIVPIISTSLVELTGSLVSPAFYLMFTSSIGCIAIATMQEYKKTSVQKLHGAQSASVSI